MEDRLRIESNERVDIRDFEHLAEQADSEVRGLVSNLFVNPDEATKRTWILDGFAMSNPGAQVLQVDLGRAILAKRTGSSIYYGAVTVNGDATKSIDMGAYADGTYYVYLRFEDVQGVTESRIFWDPAGDGSEYAQSIATRYVANWSIRIEGSSPGNEWTQIGEVSISGASLSIDSDDRNFYFEGKVSDSYTSGWSTDGGGGAQDRNADRKTYPVTDFQTFNSAMRQCLTDIKGRGLRSWYSRDIGGMNIGFDAAPVEDRLAIGAATHYLDYSAGVVTWQYEANNSLTYDSNALVLALAGADQYTINVAGILPETTSLDLGSDAKRWDKLYVKDAWVKTHPTDGDASFTIWGQTTTADEGRTRFLTQADGEFRIQAIWDNDSGGNYLMRAFRAGSTWEKLEFISIESDVQISFGEPHSGTSNQVEFNAAVVPSVTESFNLGTTSLQWNELHVHRSYLESDGAAIPLIELKDTNANVDSEIWRISSLNSGGNTQFRLEAIDDGGSAVSALEFYRLAGAPTDCFANVNLKPYGTTQTLGATSQEWASVWTKGLMVLDVDALTETPYIEGNTPGIRLENKTLETDEQRWLIGMGADMEFVIRGAADSAWTAGTDILKIIRTEDGTTADVADFDITQGYDATNGPHGLRAKNVFAYGDDTTHGPWLALYNTDSDLNEKAWAWEAVDTAGAGSLRLGAWDDDLDTWNTVLLVNRTAAAVDSVDFKCEIQLDDRLAIEGASTPSFEMSNSSSSSDNGNYELYIDGASCYWRSWEDWSSASGGSNNSHIFMQFLQNAGGNTWEVRRVVFAPKKGVVLSGCNLELDVSADNSGDSNYTTITGVTAATTGDGASRTLKVYVGVAAYYINLHATAS